MVNIIGIIIFFISCFVTVSIYNILGKLILSKKDTCFYNQTIFGAIFLSFLALTLNFLIPLNQQVNTIIQILFLITYFIILKKKFTITEVKKIFIISILILFLIAFDTEFRPDAYLYHLPFTQILNENKIIVGITNLHIRFGLVSIFQYLSASNYTYLSGLNGILIPSASFCIIIFLYFLNDIQSNFNKETLFGKLFSVLIFIYICLRINRFGEFGNDAMAHLAVFYLVSKFIYWNPKNFDTYKKILTLSVFCFLNKPFLIFTFIFPLYLFIKNLFNFKKIVLNFPVLFLIMWLTKNIIVSGCALYPLEKSCIQTFSWTDVKETAHQRVMGEAWAKSWPQRTHKNISYEEFNKNFNWLGAWKKDHLNIFLKNLAPHLIFIIVFFLLFFRKNQKIENFDIQKKNIILLFSLVGSIYFFIKFPLYRYGYSYLIVLINLIFLFQLKYFNINKFTKYTKTFVIIFMVALTLKQFQRIYKYHDTRQLIPNDRNLDVNLQKKVNKINLSEDFSYYQSLTECKYYKSPCTHLELNNIKHKKFFKYDILYKKY